MRTVWKAVTTTVWPARACNTYVPDVASGSAASFNQADSSDVERGRMAYPVPGTA